MLVARSILSTGVSSRPAKAGFPIRWPVPAGRFFSTPAWCPTLSDDKRYSSDTVGRR